jgi:hypothetical protein
MESYLVIGYRISATHPSVPEKDIPCTSRASVVAAWLALLPLYLA